MSGRNFLASGARNSRETRSPLVDDVMTPEEIIELERDSLMRRSGVTGVGLGLRGTKPVIVVLTEGSPEVLAARLPHDLRGLPVVVEHTEPIRAY